MVGTTYCLCYKVTCVEFYMKGDFEFSETSMSGVLQGGEDVVFDFFFYKWKKFQENTKKLTIRREDNKEGGVET